MNMLLCRNEQLVKCSDSHMQCLVDDTRRIEHIKNILKLKEGDDCKVGLVNQGVLTGV